MTNARVSNGARRRSLRRYYKHINAPCALCGKPIDYSLPAYHPMSFEIDEIVPISKLPEDQRVRAATSRETTQAAHRICNQRKGNKTHSDVARAKAINKPLPTSRQW